MTEMIIPIKMKVFFNVEISIYSRAGFFIYLLINKIRFLHIIQILLIFRLLKYGILIIYYN